MRDVSNKPNTLRTAKASASLRCRPETITAIRTGNVPKADPIGVARVAGIQAAKNTSLLIPYCHQVPLDFVGVEIELKENSISISTEVKAVWKTGVEMEALTAASAAALTLYDMLKIVDDTMEIVSVRLVEKRGGKTDFKGVDVSMLKAAVLVMSDRGAKGETEDLSGKAIKERLTSLGFKSIEYKIIPDEPSIIERELRRLSDELSIDLVLTTGGTGVGPRDVTSDMTSRLVERELPGVSELLRSHGQTRTNYAMLSRGVAGVRGKTVIVNLPGSPGGVRDALDVLFPWLLHAFPMMKGGGH
jgi:molybdenum cofactor biosynthesis protein MoaC